jgi:RNA polymerase sigma-32 factor
LFEESINVLNDREKEILYARRLNDQPITLDELSKKYKISRERIRQIENKAFDKLQKCMLNAAKSKNLLPAG